MDKKRRKVQPAKVIGVVIVLIAVSVGIGIRQLWLEGVFHGPFVVTETQPVGYEAMTTADTLAEGRDPVEQFARLLRQEANSPQTTRSSLKSTAGMGNVRLVLMVLITLSISVCSLFLAVFVNHRVSKAAKKASAAAKAALTEDQKRRLSEATDRIDALGSRLRGIEKKTGAILERLSRLETNLDAAGQEIQASAVALSEAGECLAEFGQFRSNVEQIHLRLAEAFSLAQDTERADVTVSEEDNEEPGEAVADSGEDTDHRWMDRYGYPLAG